MSGGLAVISSRACFKVPAPVTANPSRLTTSESPIRNPGSSSTINARGVSANGAKGLSGVASSADSPELIDGPPLARVQSIRRRESPSRSTEGDPGPAARPRRSSGPATGGRADHAFLLFRTSGPSNLVGSSTLVRRDASGAADSLSPVTPAYPTGDDCRLYNTDYRPRP